MNEAGVGASSIAGMVVHGNAQTCRQFDRLIIGNMLDAQFSMQYALAVAALSGRATLDQFSPLRSEQPEVRRLMRLVQIVDDRVLKIGEYPPLEIRLTDGRRILRQIPFAKGAPENPLSDVELEHKAMSLITPVLGGARARQLMGLIERLEEAEDLRELTDLLAAEGEARGAA